MKPSLKLLLVLPTLFLFACGGSTAPVEPRDAGAPPADSGQPADAGGAAEDGGTEDAGSSTGDAGTEDAGTQTPPQAPTLIGTQPDALGSEPQPLLLGTAEPGVTVELYTSSVCSGVVVATGTVEAQGRFAIRFPASPNAATSISAKARRGDLRSGCSTTSESYTHDDRVPRVDEATPVHNATGVSLTVAPVARFSESMAEGSVKLALTCGGQSVAGTLVASGNRATFTPTASLPEQTVCTVTVSEGADLAGNALAAHSWSFTTLRVPNPNPPTLTGTTPTSPGTSTTPSVLGNATAGIAVDLFTTSDCSGTAVASGTANGSGMFSISVTVAENSTTTFRAQTRNAAGRRSACSTQSRTYVHDSVVPTVASTRPESNAVGVETNTLVSATFSEPVKNTSGVLTVECGGVARQGSVSVTATVLTFTPAQPLPFDVSCTARVSTNVTDLAGNPLAAAYSWSFTMKESPIPGPPTLSLTTPASPGNSLTPTVSGTATAGHLIELYTGGDCSGTPVASGTVNAQGQFAIAVPVGANATTFITATARVSLARPASSCTPQVLVYRHDGVAPTVVSVSPVNDATDVQPAATLFVDFSELITAQTGDVELRCSDVPLPGTVSVAERRLTFSPAVQLWIEATCIATVRTRVRDTAGNALASAYSWSFMTRPAGWNPGPVVATTASGSVTNVEVGLSNAGNATLVWRGGQSPFATTRHELNPQQGVSSGLKLNTVDSRTPAVATSANGHSVIAWVESSSGVPARVVATVFIPGLGWSTPEMLSAAGLGPMDPQVAIDNSGQALVVFRQHPSGSVLSYSIFARRFLPGSGWQTLTEIDGVPQEFVDAKEPSVTRDGRGGFLVVWSGEFNRGSGYNYYLFFNWLRAGSTPGAASWTGSMYFFNELYPSRPRAGCDVQGNCTLVYTNQSSRARAVRYEPAQDWGTPFFLGPVDAGTEGVGVAVNAVGQVVAAFSHYSSTLTDYEVMVRQYEPGVGWGTPVSVGPVVTGARGTGFFDVGIDAQGNAVVLSRQSAPSASPKLYASRFQVGVGWRPAEEVDSDIGWSAASSNERAWGPRVAMNASGQALVSYWKDNTVYARWLE